MPPGAVSLDDVDLDQVSTDYVLNCAKKGREYSLVFQNFHFSIVIERNGMKEVAYINVGGMADLSEAIRDYHDSTLFPNMVSLNLLNSYFIFISITDIWIIRVLEQVVVIDQIYIFLFTFLYLFTFFFHFLEKKKNKAGPADEFFLVTDLVSSGSPPRREPPVVPIIMPSSILPSLATAETHGSIEDEELMSLTKSQSLNSAQVQELTVDDIDGFDEDEDFEEVDTQRYSRRVLNDSADLALGLPSFATGE